MASILRANPYLEEIIEILDVHLEKCGGDVDLARDRLSASENEWIDAEILRCMVDRRYFISNYYAYRDEKEGFKGLYPLFDSHEILYEEYRKLEKAYGRVRALVLKARQMGSTTYNAAEFFAQTIFQEHTNSIIVGQDQGQATFIMGMYESALDFIPWWMRPRIKGRNTGAFINFDERDDAIRTVRPGLKSWIYADNANKPSGVGRGKCQVPWTYVWTEAGPMRLDTIFETTCSTENMLVDADGGEWYTPSRELYTWAFDGSSMKRRRITKIYRQEYRGIIQKICLSSGVEIEKTPEHRILSNKKWTNTLIPGDHADCVRVLDWRGSKVVDPKFAELLAWQIAEGCESEWNVVTITQKDDMLRDRIASLAEHVTGVRPINKKGEELKGENRAGYVLLSGPSYKKRLVSMGYEWGKRSATKSLPEEVFGWNKEGIAVFLRAFFEAEGSVSDKVEIVTASKRIAEGLKMLCVAFGISLRIRKTIKYAANSKNKIRRTYYRGNISGPCMLAFREHIGFISTRKQHPLDDLCEKSNGYTLKQYPYVTDMFRKACKESKTPFKKILGEARNSRTQNMSYIAAHKALERMDQIVKELPIAYPRGTHHAYKNCDQKVLGDWADKIRAELDSELCQEKVEAVSEYEYEGAIFDLEVEDVHNYPTSGVVTHNTFGRALLSELAFWENGSQLSKSLFPTMNTVDGFYVMESTANGRNDFWHNLWRRAEAGKIDWHPIFIPFYRREKTYSMPILKTQVFVLSEEEKGMRERIFKKESFLIKDETFNWMRNKKEEFIATDGDDTMFSQEYTSEPEESFQSSAVTAFPRGIIRKYTKLTINPKWVGEISYDWKLGRPKPHIRVVKEDEDLPNPEREDRFRIWEMPIRGAGYTMGVDVSLGNEGGDYSCVQVVKQGQGHELDEQVAVWRGLIDPDGLAEIVFAIGWMYNEALAAVEVNSMGMVTNNTLIRSLEYENIYRFKRLDRLKNFMTDIIGWWTDDKSKRALMAKMSKTFLEDQIYIRDKYTMDEFNDFTEGGALGEGAHDDYVMALMIALYCGHEGEIGRRQEEREKRPDPTLNKFAIKDRFNTIIAITTSQNEAERVSKKHVGSTIERTSSATATVVLGGQKRKVPADFANTEFSPIHDKTGTAHRLHYEEDVPAEAITPEMIAEFEDSEEQSDNDPNAWLYS